MEDVGLAGLAAASALGRGVEAQLAGALAGVGAFTPVDRFDGVAAVLPDAGSLADELTEVVSGACAGLSRVDRAGCPLVLAVHGYPGVPRVSVARMRAAAELGEWVAGRVGLGVPVRAYTSGSVSASDAVADAAELISAGRASRIVVAAGCLVDSDQLAVFEHVLAVDGAVRPFSVGRTGLLLGDAVVAVVVESVASMAKRGVLPLARLAGWGRARDAGMARAIRSALRRAGLDAADLGYVNADGTGLPDGDATEAAELRSVLGSSRIPVSSTKAVHGHALEASGLLELVITVRALRSGKLPVNAGFLGPDPACDLDLILDVPRPVDSPYALSVNTAFGGASTALVVRV